ncbi:anti-sigma factor [Pelagibius litoralis]|uniref:Anti-sigma factor n=1 Tax=Pelagibius litoralis TaxID=374515 RepID=A0A967KDI4_9PROT|nr:cupin domain-containing protein [Pelagibius litoralis]NIA70245.1 anti-sigma factor [Pelagibius litoralis]
MPDSLNADFSRPAAMDTAMMDWQASPSPTVWRKRLDLLDGEFSRVTSVVRYDPDSDFHSHDHPQGEEILVLEGTFSDEHGNYPAGTFLLNPQGFRHAPFSKDGCVLFVKLCQFAGEGRDHVVVHSRSADWQAAAPGVERLSLYEDAAYPEDIMLLRLAPGASLPATLINTAAAPQGLEIFVTSGRLTDGRERYGSGAWLREPSGFTSELTAQTETTLYLKRNHLSVKT